MATFGNIFHNLRNLTPEPTLAKKIEQEEIRNHITQIIKEQYDKKTIVPPPPFIAPNRTTKPYNPEDNKINIDDYKTTIDDDKYTPLTMIDTKKMFIQEQKQLTHEEMLVKLFSTEPTLIEALSLIADDEKILTMDIIIYILNDFFHPIEHK